jgi:hypothetical protein
MARRWPLIAAVAAIAGLAATQRREISRYFKIKQMSWGTGHPSNVPVGGAQGYARPGHGVPDGTGDFDSGRRGGPAAT